MIYRETSRRRSISSTRSTTIIEQNIWKEQASTTITTEGQKAKRSWRHLMCALMVLIPRALLMWPLRLSLDKNLAEAPSDKEPRGELRGRHVFSEPSFVHIHTEAC